MADKVDNAGAEPRCDICLDLRRTSFKGSIESLEISGLQGCLICSMIYAGIKKCEGGDPRKQTRLRAGPRNQIVGTNKDSDSQWNYFVTRVPVHEEEDAPSTLQVLVGSGPECLVTQLEFYTDSENGSRFTGVLYRNHIDPVLDLGKAVQFIQRQLKICEESHICMPLEPSSLPQRVLDVGSKEHDNIFLFETCGENVPYITLSHCWGTEPMLRTTKANYNHRKIGIPWSKFPATFKDAIKITRALHIRYLWIDSLCIVQGDKLDWEKQSGLMATIYSNCYLNLAATHASNSNGGLFLRRWIPSVHTDSGQRKLRSVKSHSIFPIQAGTAGDNERVFVRRSLENAHIDVLVLDIGWRDYNVVECAPLLTRAWAYQERLLSPRSVNFHSAELTWDCGATFDCECGRLLGQQDEFQSYHQVLRKRCFVGPVAHRIGDEYIWNTWLDVVTHFSKLKLTFSKDKLPALAGVARRVSKIIQSEYLAGIWQADVVRGLLWCVDYAPKENIPKRHLSTRANPYRAPTWSWASIDLVDSQPCSIWISYNFLWSRGDMVSDERFRVLDWNCDVVGSNPYGCVANGHLLVKGAALATILYYDGLGTDFTYDWHLAIQPNVEICYYDFNVRKEGDLHIPEGETIIAMVIGVQVSTAWAILLAPSKKISGKYERIGVISIKEEHFKYAEEMVLDII